MDAVELLKQDHRIVEDGFKQFEEAGKKASRARRGIVEKLTAALVPHMAVEEQYFYPLSRERLGDQGEHQVLESVEEHHLVKVLLKEIAALSPDDERYEAKVSVLKEIVLHHVKEEEEKLFPMTAKACSREEMAELGEKLEAHKKDVPARPNPDIIGIATRRRAAAGERGRRTTTRSLAARTSRGAPGARGRKTTVKATVKTTARKSPARKSPAKKGPGRGKKR